MSFFSCLYYVTYILSFVRSKATLAYEPKSAQMHKVVCPVLVIALLFNTSFYRYPLSHSKHSSIYEKDHLIKQITSLTTFIFEIPMRDNFHIVHNAFTKCTLFTQSFHTKNSRLISWIKSFFTKYTKAHLHFQNTILYKIGYIIHFEININSLSLKKKYIKRMESTMEYSFIQ